MEGGCFYFHLIQFNLRFPVLFLQYHMYYILISWLWQVGWLVDWLSRCLALICICSSSNHRHPIIPHAEFLSYMCDALKYSLFCQLEWIFFVSICSTNIINHYICLILRSYEKLVVCFLGNKCCNSIKYTLLIFHHD